jgi:general secretion pathway protein F
MPKFNYRALNASGEMVAGTLEAPSAERVVERVLELGLIPIADETAAASAPVVAARGARPRAEEIVVFSRDLALLLRSGTRINDALDLMSGERELGRMRAVAGELHEAVLGGKSFAEALGARPETFPPLYLALVGIGEQTATVAPILEGIALEGARAEALRRRIVDALRYPAFLMFSACGVLTFFLTFVLPQFSSLFNDMQVKPDPVLAAFFAASASLRENGAIYAAVAIVVASALGFTLRSARARAYLFDFANQLPVLGTIFEHHRTILFCRNLALLLSGGVPLSAALRVLVDVMAATGSRSSWSGLADNVRRGGKLSEALNHKRLLPAMAVRTLRLGEETNQLPTLASRVADYFEARLDRNIDRIVGVAGPVAILVISAIVGGLIVSVMTALLSVNQMVE